MSLTEITHLIQTINNHKFNLIWTKIISEKSARLLLDSFLTAGIPVMVLFSTFNNIRHYIHLLVINLAATVITPFADRFESRTLSERYLSAPQPYKNGDYAGVENVTLNKTNLPPHFHMMVVENAPGDVAIMTNRLAIPDYKAETTEIIQIYSNDESSQVTLNPDTIKAVGNAAQHPNRQPYLTINYCIAMVGIYPTRPY